MAKQIPDRVAQWGRQTPDGRLEWVSDSVAAKIGWTTAAGRAADQATYDDQLERLGLKPGPATQLQYYTRDRYTAYTDPQLIVDTVVEDYDREPATTAIDVIQGYLDEATAANPAAVPAVTPAAPVIEVPVPAETIAPLAQDTDVNAAIAAVAEPAAPTVVINNALIPATQLLTPPPAAPAQ